MFEDILEILPSPDSLFKLISSLPDDCIREILSYLSYEDMIEAGIDNIPTLARKLKQQYKTYSFQHYVHKMCIKEEFYHIPLNVFEKLMDNLVYDEHKWCKLDMERFKRFKYNRFRLYNNMSLTEEMFDILCKEVIDFPIMFEEKIKFYTIRNASINNHMDDIKNLMICLKNTDPFQMILNARISHLLSDFGGIFQLVAPKNYDEYMKHIQKFHFETPENTELSFIRVTNYDLRKIPIKWVEKYMNDINWQVVSTNGYVTKKIIRKYGDKLLPDGLEAANYIPSYLISYMKKMKIDRSDLLPRKMIKNDIKFIKSWSMDKTRNPYTNRKIKENGDMWLVLDKIYWAHLLMNTSYISSLKINDVKLLPNYLDELRLSNLMKGMPIGTDEYVRIMDKKFMGCFPFKFSNGKYHCIRCNKPCQIEKKMTYYLAYCKDDDLYCLIKNKLMKF